MVRSPMQVDDEFRQRIKKIQEEIMKKKGKFTSIPKITKEISKMPEWSVIEKKLIGDINKLEKLEISFDGREGC